MKKLLINNRMVSRYITTIVTIILVMCAVVPASAGENNADIKVNINWTDGVINMGSYSPVAITVDTEGNSYITGQSSYNGVSSGLHKFDKDGKLCTSFGSNGSILPEIYSYAVCIDKEGRLLVGNSGSSGSPDIYIVDKDTGTYTTKTFEKKIKGIIADETNIYINGGTSLYKYDYEFNIISSATITDSFGLCRDDEGSFYTSNEKTRTVYKYNSDMTVDNTFGTNGSYKVSNENIGFPTYAEGSLYISCHGEKKVYRILGNGKSLEEVISGATVVSFNAMYTKYFAPLFTDNKVRCYDRPDISIEEDNMEISISPTVVDAGSATPVNVIIKFDSTKEYVVKAILIDKTTGEIVKSVTSSAETLVDGDATITLTPDSSGWKKGIYAVQINLSTSGSGIIVSDTLNVEMPFGVDVYKVSFNNTTPTLGNVTEVAFVDKNATDKSVKVTAVPAKDCTIDKEATTASSGDISFDGDNIIVSNITEDVQVNVIFTNPEIKLELNNKKNNAKTELDTYVSGLTESDYTANNWNEITGILAKAKTDIDAATIITQIEPIVTKAKTDIDEVLTVTEQEEIETAKKLAEEKTNKKTELDTYVSGLTESDYTADNWNEIKDILAKAKTDIDAATIITQIEPIVTKAKTDID